MSATSFASAIALAAVMAAGVGISGAAAQNLPLPAEFPPASFTGTQYVDSKGCAFVRAGIAGMVNWVPRVDRARQQLCNFQPTAVARTAPTPDPLPNVPIITVDAQPAPVAPRAAPAPVATPAPPPRVAAAAPQVRAPRPAPVTAPAPRADPLTITFTPPPATPRVVTAPTPPAPRRITLAEACDGRTGIQPGFISATTRQPIDCGGVTRVAAAAQPRMATMPVAGPTPQRLTLAAACAQQAATGRTLINAATNQPIVCADPAPFAVAAMPQVRVAQPATTVTSACGIARLAGDGRYPVRCGPQALSPSGGLSGGVQVARAATTFTTGGVTASVSTRTTKPLFGAGPVPASNAPVAVAQATVPRGYARVWDDGRINPQRGVTQPQVQVAARVSSRSVAPVAVQAPAASGHRYVQVGSFGDPANAARLIARLQAAGLPVASAKSGSLKVIAAGPFRSPADLNQALNIVRGMGFADAYLRS